jgi:hypothetical protein
MKICIDDKILQENDFSLQDFGVLLYYIGGGVQNIDEYICNKLWSRGYLIKELTGYSFNPHLAEELEFWAAKSNPKIELNNLESLAIKMKEMFPQGRKDGTALMWRGSTQDIVKKLATLKNKYNTDFTEEQALNATKRYIESFNGDYKFMQVLKYFILKKDLNKGEETSQLLAYIENENQEDFTGEIGELL